MESAIASVRPFALRAIMLARRPSVPAEQLCRELGFDITDPDDQKECGAVVRECGGALVTAGHGRPAQDVRPGVLLDCKVSRSRG
jgi:hypothetical protein